jgi:hypothetical protein
MELDNVTSQPNHLSAVIDARAFLHDHPRRYY